MSVVTMCFGSGNFRFIFPLVWHMKRYYALTWPSESFLSFINIFVVML